MATRKKTKLFMSGNSQAVRYPREFQLEGDEVEIQPCGNAFVIRPKKQTWQSLLDSLTLFTDDFMEGGRQQPLVRKRKSSFTWR
ncbi:MAG: antitoxin [Nitrospira sp.]|nr:antitoxin [Nitrospira sp.]